ncbi:permease-like cell division protein FtsX [Alkalihalophilus marmarensis]|jgi:cell division transport system permease protein|uniref:permease-like cell division protein FtsX n=1 Tax=Alkalihalophilus marmarensis TaxID=521377 RepID=UPI00203DEC85|nr:permease-like cell division protein FtsX [Alkalihalophilus marmarensis]MCM3491714.1 permease-like cell division protein FtsX [Alkalihalophilus marmarensis]
MKFRTLGRHVKEGTKNLGRNGWMTFASISAVTVMLLVVGAFLLLILNANNFASSVEDDVEIRAYIELTATPEQQEELRTQIENTPNVESVTFLSKDEGLDQLIDSLNEAGSAFESIREENPLNDAFIVRAASPQLTESISQQIDEMPYVESTNYGQDFVERLFAFTDLARTIGVILIVGMMFTAMFLIANTIKITIIARKREIQIMKLVGATNGFIRWPFFVEGLLLGVVGSLIPIVVLGFGYSYLYSAYGAQFEMLFFSLLSPFPYIWQIAALLVGIGAFIGVWGSVMSVRKFLKV